METITREGATDSVTLNNIEIEGGLLLELLEGVASHASKDKNLRSIYGVQIEGKGGLFTARATDKFRLIEGSAPSLDGSLALSLVSLDDVKRIFTLLKAHKSHRIGLTRIGDALTVSALGDAITFTLVEANLPPMEDLLVKSEGEPVAVEGVAFNPAYMADYAKIAGKGEAIKIYFNGENKPMRVRITGDKIVWRALLMPMRYKD